MNVKRYLTHTSTATCAAMPTNKTVSQAGTWIVKDVPRDLMHRRQDGCSRGK